MKTKLFVLSIPLFLTIFSGTTFAISGACSSHSGVNCLAGSSATGKAICKDGFISNTSYYLADECNYGDISSCAMPYSAGCKTESDYNALLIQINWRGVIGSSFDTSYACRAQIEDYKSQMNAYSTCISQESQNKKNAIDTSVSAIIKERDSVLSSTCSGFDPLTVWDAVTKSCICIADHQFRDGKCITNNAMMCYRVNGDHAQLQADGSCGCENNYWLDKSNLCVYGIKPKLKLTANIKKFLEFGNKCFDSKLFTELERKACLTYESNPRYYDLVIVDSLEVNTATTNSVNLTPKIQTITDSKESKIVNESKEFFNFSKKKVSEPMSIQLVKNEASSSKIIISTTTPITKENIIKKIAKVFLNWFR